ncbi:MAG: D-aminoacyl-tRNA deacylase [Pirellulales bacterium]|jgi:D-tyrosyl-tRNA(Tyr) deacylase
MRAVIQRVSKACVTIDHKETATIGRGLLVFLGVETGDTSADVQWLAGKVARLRIFPDEQDKMNKNIQEIQGEMLVVSQFTLFADTQKGNRPSFFQAAKPDEAMPRYEEFLQKIEQLTGHTPAHGTFAADMQVALINDGPVTILIDSQEISKATHQNGSCNF